MRGLVAGIVVFVTCGIQVAAIRRCLQRDPHLVAVVYDFG